MNERPAGLSFGAACALAAASFAAQFTPAHAQLDNGLVAYWELESDAVIDSVDIYVGTPNGTTAPTFPEGKFGNAVQLDGTNQDITITGGDENVFDFDFIDGGTGSMSVSAWCKVDSFTKDWQALVAKGEGNVWRVARRGGSQIMSCVVGTGDIPTDDVTGPVVSDGAWHHVVATGEDTGSSKLYVNGALVAENFGPVTITKNSTNRMRIGNNPDSTGRSWHGQIDDVAIWDRAITEAEVAMLWAGGTGAPVRDFITDTDGDGIFDRKETQVGLDPNVSNAGLDTDGDSLLDYDEVFIFGTDPLVINGMNTGEINQTGEDVSISAAFVRDDGGNPLPVDYTVQYLSRAYQPGVLADIYFQANPGNLNAINNIISSSAPDASVVIPSTAWSDPGAVFGYPEEFEAATGGRFVADESNFIVNHTGELFIPPKAERMGDDPDTIKFTDGIDDFSYLEVDGVVLINDNSWSTVDRAGGNGAPIVPFDVSDPRFDDGLWVPFRSTAGENEGGDAGVIYWDATFDDGFFPVANLEFIAPEYAIPDANFRYPTLASTHEVSGNGTPENMAVDPLQADTLQLRLIAGSEEIDRLDVDRDGDGMTDLYEIRYGLDPLDAADADTDLDEDGLANLAESQIGTRPDKADTDGDTVSDGDEVNTHMTSPLATDTDLDSLRDDEDIALCTDPLDPDTDKDGISDGTEVANGDDPCMFALPGYDTALVAYWQFEGDLMDTQGDNHGTNLGLDPIIYVTGKVGGGMAAALDGLDQAIEINPANEDTFDFGAPDTQSGFTISAWFTVESFAVDWQCLIAKGEGNRWRIHRNGANPSITGNGGSADVPASTPVDDGEWHHLALVSEPGVGVTLYVDGAVEGTGPAPTLENNTMPLTIGDNPDARNRFWWGNIDDVGAWARPLSEEEVMGIWNGGDGASIADLIAGGPPGGGGGTIRITSFTYDAGSDSYTLVWTSEDGKSYDIFGSADFATWLDEIAGEIPATGDSTFQAIPAALLQPGEYYLRVQEEATAGAAAP